MAENISNHGRFIITSSALYAQQGGSYSEPCSICCESLESKVDLIYHRAAQSSVFHACHLSCFALATLRALQLPGTVGYVIRCPVCRQTADAVHELFSQILVAALGNREKAPELCQDFLNTASELFKLGLLQNALIHKQASAVDVLITEIEPFKDRAFIKAAENGFLWVVAKLYNAIISGYDQEAQGPHIQTCAFIAAARAGHLRAMQFLFNQATFQYTYRVDNLEIQTLAKAFVEACEADQWVIVDFLLSCDSFPQEYITERGNINDTVAQGLLLAAWAGNRMTVGWLMENRTIAEQCYWNNQLVSTKEEARFLAAMSRCVATALYLL